MSPVSPWESDERAVPGVARYAILGATDGGAYAAEARLSAHLGTRLCFFLALR